MTSSDATTQSSVWWNGQTGRDWVVAVQLSAATSKVVAHGRIVAPGSVNPHSYAVFYSGSGHQIFLYDFSKNGFNSLAAQVAVTLAAGDWVGLSAVDTTIEAWTQSSGAWTQRIQVTNTTVSGIGFGGAAIASGSPSGTGVSSFAARTLDLASQTSPLSASPALR